MTDAGSSPAPGTKIWGMMRSGLRRCLENRCTCDEQVGDRHDPFPASLKIDACLVKWYNQTLPVFSQGFDSLSPHQFYNVSTLYNDPTLE